jgi:hypothetical protein
VLESSVGLLDSSVDCNSTEKGRIYLFIFVFEAQEYNSC